MGITYKRMIYQYDLNGNFIAEYESIREAMDLTKINRKNIIECCEGLSITKRNFYWSYKYYMKLPKEIIQRNEKNLFVNNLKKVYQYNLDGDFIKEFKSMSEIKKKYKTRSLSNHLNKNSPKRIGEFRYSYEKKDNIGKYRNYTLISIKNQKPVIQYDLNGKFIKLFDTIREAQKELNIKGGIGSCCLKRPKYYTAGGFMWRYYNGSLKDLSKDDIMVIPKSYNERLVNQYNLNGKFIKSFNSIREAQKETYIKTIYDCVSGKQATAGGFVWKYKETTNQR